MVSEIVVVNATLVVGVCVSVLLSSFPTGQKLSNICYKNSYIRIGKNFKTKI